MITSCDRCGVDFEIRNWISGFEEVACHNKYCIRFEKPVYIYDTKNIVYYDIHFDEGNCRLQGESNFDSKCYEQYTYHFDGNSIFKIDTYLPLSVNYNSKDIERIVKTIKKLKNFT